MSVLRLKDELGRWYDIPSIKGETGDAAGFGTATASVDTGTGTPSCVVTLTGDDTAKNFDFAFHNLMYDDSDLQDDFADLANDFDVLQGQFDTAVSAVTTDTEVTDIRVGADGVTDTTAGASVRRQFTDLKADTSHQNTQINAMGSVLEYPLSFQKTNARTSAYLTDIIVDMPMIKGYRYDFTVTLASAASQAVYVQFYKGETKLKETSISTGNTTSTFYYDITESGNDYHLAVTSGAWSSHFAVSATVIPRTTGSVIADIQAEQNTFDTKQNAITKLLHNTTTKRYYSANMFDGEYVSGQYVNTSGSSGYGAYGYTKNLIRVKEGDTISASDGSSIRSMRFVTAYDADYEPIPASGAEVVDSYTVPSGVEYVRISVAQSYIESASFAVQNSTVMLPYDTYNAKDFPIDSATYHDKHYIVSSNLFDGEYISGKGIRNDGSMFNDGNYGVTKNFIPVDAGDNIVVTQNNGIRYMRFIAAYDQNYKALADKGVSGGTYSYWTVPDGVYYIKITSPTAVISANDFGIYRSKGLVFKSPDTYSIVETDNRNLLRMKHEPLRLMPDYMADTLSYRPLGNLQKGYICMITDDGTAGLASYTIPLAISENIPMTFAVMKDSEVFADASMTATVLDAVNNHNCSLAQHGGTLWDLMSEIDLNNFFDAEKAYFDTLGVELKGAVIPQHRTNSLVKAVAGARFGVVRSGYTGLGEDDTANGSISNYYSHYTSGARSNLYGLSSYNCAYSSIAYNRAAADYAKANNKIMVVYFHEFDTYAEQQAVVEDLISYAKTIGLEFITLGDIPTLETWDGVE